MKRLTVAQIDAVVEVIDLHPDHPKHAVLQRAKEKLQHKLEDSRKRERTRMFGHLRRTQRCTRCNGNGCCHCQGD